MGIIKAASSDKRVIAVSHTAVAARALIIIIIIIIITGQATTKGPSQGSLLGP